MFLGYVFIQSHCRSCWKLVRCCCWWGIEGSGPALSGPAQKNVLVSPLWQPGMRGAKLPARCMPWEVWSKPAPWLFCTPGESPSGLFHEGTVSWGHCFKGWCVSWQTSPASPVTSNTGVAPCLCAGAWVRIILAPYRTVKPLPRFLTDGLGGILCQVCSCMD